jgi:hypothetical protein
MTFDPNQHMMNLKGKQYLPVAARLVWFRQEHPDWDVRTEIVRLEEDWAVVKATIGPAASGESYYGTEVRATGHKMEHRAHFPDFMEKAETGAIGRALAVLGYGTQFAPEFDEGQQRIVDTPQEPRRKQDPTPMPQAAAIPPKQAPTLLPAEAATQARSALHERYDRLLTAAAGYGIPLTPWAVQPGWTDATLTEKGIALKALVDEAKAKQGAAA